MNVMNLLIQNKTKKGLEHHSLDVREQQQKNSYTMELNELVNFPLILREFYSNEAIFHFALCQLISHLVRKLL